MRLYAPGGFDRVAVETPMLGTGYKTGHPEAGTSAADAMRGIVIERNRWKVAVPHWAEDMVSQRTIAGIAQAQTALVNPTFEAARMALDPAEWAAACWAVGAVAVARGCHSSCPVHPASAAGYTR